MKMMTCIVCPIGCRISVLQKDGKYIFSGNRCARGLDFAETELTSPMRSLTTTVRTVFPGVPALPVRTKGEIPKGMIPEVMRELSKVRVKERIGIGETVVPDILGSGVDVIATGDLLQSIEDKRRKNGSL